MFFGIFAKRRTSRPKRKTSAQRKTSRKPFKGKVRKGAIGYQGLSATVAKGRYAGRVKLQRSALVEYPTADQFAEIARQRKIPKHVVDQAFGHLMKEARNKPKLPRKTSRRPPRRTSRKRRRTKRRTSRHGRIRRNPAGKRTIRRDYISVPTTTEGHRLPFTATVVDVPEQLVGVIGARTAIGISVAGEKTTILSAPEAMWQSAPWVSRKEFRKAFGYLLKGSVLGDIAPQRKIPQVYGPRVMKLGHLPQWTPGDPIPSKARGDEVRGTIVSGIVPGQLILFHRSSGQIAWQAWDDEDNNPKKPILIKYGGATGHFDFDKAVRGARVRAGAQAAGAEDLSIPAMAMLEAFGYLLPKAKLTRAYELFTLTK